MYPRVRFACLSSSLLLGLSLTACGDDGSASGETDSASSSTAAPTTGTPTTNNPTTTDPTGTTDPTTTDPTTTDPTTTDPTDTDSATDTDGTTGEPAECPYTPIEGKQTVGLELVAGGFNQALHVIGDPIDRDVLYVVQHGGTIKRLEPGVTEAPEENWLDVDVVGGSGGNEQGLFSLAFHPDYADNGLIYIAHTPTSAGGAVYVTEYQVSGGVVDTGSARDVIGISQPASNHNGGQIEFGTDGMLYFSLGDGGPQNNGCNSGQAGNALLGKILRIDPAADGSPDTTPGCASGCPCAGQDGFDYTIPGDNPFVGDDSIRDEVWTLGVRNPWRFSIDRETGRMFVADVGQGAWEEVSVASAGANLGWSEMEGAHCFGGAACDTSVGPGEVNADGLTLPITEYSHAVGVSISGIGIYRGCEVPSFDGLYFYGDIDANAVFAVHYDGTTATEFGTVATLPSNLVTWGGGSNAYGDVFIAANPSPYIGGGPGSIYRITAAK